MRTHRPLTLTIVVLVSLISGFSTSGAIADEPDKERTPTPTPVPKRTPAPRTIAEAARQAQVAKARDPETGKIVISNQNLKELAKGGAVTTAKPGSSSGTGREQVELGSREPGNAGPTASGASTAGRREYWVNRYTQQERLIESLEAQVEKLDAEIPALWNQFYAWDDPAYRDGVIKPKLDRALENHKTVSEQLQTERPKLNQIREEARRDGAEPGWFRGLD